MESTHDTRVEIEMKHVFQAFRKLGDALAWDVKTTWDQDIEPKLVQLDLTAERVTERTWRVAIATMRHAFGRHPKKSTTAEA